MPTRRKTATELKAEAEAERRAALLTSLNEARKRFLELQQKVEDIKEEMDRIKAEARPLGLGTHQLDTGEVVVSPNHRFHEETADKVLGAINADLRAACKVPKYDTDLVKKLFPGAVYAQCMKESGAAKVSFR